MSETLAPLDDSPRAERVLTWLMLEEQRHLRLLLLDLRQQSRNSPPLKVAFACLMIAEEVLVAGDWSLEEAAHVQLRSFMLEIAEKLGA